jgi:hypothetical protein
LVQRVPQPTDLRPLQGQLLLTIYLPLVAAVVVQTVAVVAVQEVF